MPRELLGTAGHIDHGKTSLVKALTGVGHRRRGIRVEHAAGTTLQ
jgi:translation initiation factor 2 gamma subunit (eIF-2gamma)